MSLEYFVGVLADLDVKTLRMEMDIRCDHTGTDYRLKTYDFIVDGKDSIPRIMGEMSSGLCDIVAVFLRETSIYELDEDWLPLEHERSDFEEDESVFGSKIVGHSLVIGV